MRLTDIILHQDKKIKSIAKKLDVAVTTLYNWNETPHHMNQLHILVLQNELGMEFNEWMQGKMDQLKTK